MQDLNDFYYFAEVVSHGGFAPAGRALGTPKSKLSRRVAQLEERLGARLIERSSRRFRITDVGQAFYARCCSMLLEAERAQAAVADMHGEPRGLVRFSCPLGLVEPLAPVVNAYLERYPAVRLDIAATNKAVDLIEERIDVALRVRDELGTDASLTMRHLTLSRRILVASPVIAAGIAADADVAALAKMPTLSTTGRAGDDSWTLAGPDGTERTIRHAPRMICGAMSVLRDAAIAGLGVALLPDTMCRDGLRDESLVHVFPNWRAPDGVVHLVFTTRRGLPPAAAAFIEQLVRAFRGTAVL